MDFSDTALNDDNDYYRHSIGSNCKCIHNVGLTVFLLPFCLAGGTVFLAGTVIYNVLDPVYNAGTIVVNRVVNCNSSLTRRLNHRISNLSQHINSDDLLQNLVGRFKRFSLTPSNSTTDHERVEGLLRGFESFFASRGESENKNKNTYRDSLLSLICKLSKEANTFGYRLSFFRGCSSSSFEKMIIDLQEIIDECTSGIANNL